MRKSIFIGTISALILFLSPNVLLAQSELPNPGRVLEVEVPAPALKGNLVGTNSIQKAAIYLPPGYDLSEDRRYPVIYLLHGIFDDYGVWVENFEVPKILDRLIARDEIPDLIVVMPNGGNRFGGGFYRNSPVTGNWADYIAENLVDFVDNEFRTVANTAGRAVVGHSMGGYGALNLAITRPDVFSVIWALSPCCLVPEEDLSFGNDAWRRAAAVEKIEDLQELLEAGDFYPIALLGIVTAFSPDLNAAPLYGDFPFDIVRGEIVLDDEALDRYLDQFPVRQIRNARESLRSLHGLGMSVGLDDQFLHIPSGTLKFSQELGKERVPHRLDVYDGDHRELVGERLESTAFPWVAERLTSTK
ncbi:alpha/beta fold hydrolase [uncultured Roseibium sp.]|uniref:alpha/beta hydrolase n=1 Tax=uncultured Roseibium sp. TaxID=1936171 RepID=UPI00262AE430|nr:alpha/beta fold hydrolase [uncultured Roseibium sp.]